MHLPPLIQDLTVILGVAAAVTFLFRLAKQPIVLAYIIAGIIVGPYSLPALSVVDVDSVKVWAELGVIFLMFALGLEFSFRRLAKVGPQALAAGVISLSLMLLIGYHFAKSLGLSPVACFFVAAMLAISSTTIIIKTLSELGLKTRKFAELIFGILIVEDLAAILILVALTNVANSEVVNWLSLLYTAGKLMLVIGGWLILGLFLIPKLTRLVSHKGNSEMLLIMSLGLCLAMVSLSTYFSYSAALGAFVMGAIIAETREAHHVENLVSPLKDVFGAIFFVSVGMLLQPSVIMENLDTLALICLVIILGKSLAVSIGALLTGQSIRTAVYTSFTMAQIGEFSFIIATLGLSLHAIDEKIYPLIVGASLITTFTTPYMIKLARPFTNGADRYIPKRIKSLLNSYAALIQRQSPNQNQIQPIYHALFRWIVNAILVVIVFILSGEEFLPALQNKLDSNVYPTAIAWFTTFFASLPFIWAMFTSFQPKHLAASLSDDGEKRGVKEHKSNKAAIIQLLGQLASILLLAVVSTRFLPAWLAGSIALVLSTVLFFLFRNQIEAYYLWFEKQFLTGIEEKPTPRHKQHSHLIPWDAHLAEIELVAGSAYIGKTLQEARIREKFSINLVVIRRNDDHIVAPGATERLFPGDFLLCFGSDDDLENFRSEIMKVHAHAEDHNDILDYSLRAVPINQESPAAGKNIKDAKIKERFGCLIVGMEREGQRIANPDSNTEIQAKDLLWLVGERSKLDRLQNHLQCLEIRPL